ncbi:unnamed protein product [Leptosia nina]|uniref:Uncharacterized protein n=1 Tax=Leptosia nina TaxID=320188 RepID=A0AAV1K2Z8_9NEOP
MLCPEITNFKPPKTTWSFQKNVCLERTLDRVNLNNFYRSAIVTCPDELYVPNHIKEALLEDSDYYKIINCSVIEFIDPLFIDTFIRRGKLYCLSIQTNCISGTAVALTPDGILTLHVFRSKYQTLGVEGTKRPHDFYEIRLDLHNLKQNEKIKSVVTKFGKKDFYISWNPFNDSICPSTLAKHFFDKGYTVTQHSLDISILSSDISEIPSLEDDIDEVVEWMGMLAHGANLATEENYISTYSVPETLTPLKSKRISIMNIKGFLTPNVIGNICKCMSQHTSSRDLEHYWTALSVQTIEESLYQWHPSSPRMFQSHNSSCNIFFTQMNQLIYSVSQLKYS